MDYLVVESHPDRDNVDLYIHPNQLALFPELADFLRSFDLETTDLKTFEHIPYPALLVQLLDQWKSQVCSCFTFQYRHPLLIL